MRAGLSGRKALGRRIAASKARPPAGFIARGNNSLTVIRKRTK